VIRLLSNARALIARRDALGLTDLMRRPRFRRPALSQGMTRGDLLPAQDALELIEDAHGCTAFGGFVDSIRGAEPIQPARLPPACRVRVAWARTTVRSRSPVTAVLCSPRSSERST
jgi:hypothetical protein